MADSLSCRINRDSRGVRRGRCTEDGCNCEQYDGSTSGKKCVACHHHPGKHINLDNPQGCVKCGCRTQFNFKYCHPDCRDKDLLEEYRSNLSASILNLEEHLKSLPQIIVKKCKAMGCDRTVFYDYQTEFLYCSPKCRDNDILEDDHLKLINDIRTLENSLFLLSCTGRQQSKGTSVDKPTLSSHSDVQSEKSDCSKLTSPVKPLKDQQPEAASNNGGLPANLRKNGRERKRSGSHSSKKKKRLNDKNGRPCQFLKEANRDHGIIVCNCLWDTGDGEKGFLITGVMVDEKLMSYNYMQSGQLRIFDIITVINGTLVAETSKDSPQKMLDKALFDKTDVHLTIQRPQYSLNSTAKCLAVVKGSTKKPSHVIGIVNPKNFCSDIGEDFGMENIDNVTFAMDVRTRSSADLCGLRNEDNFIAGVKGLPCDADVSRSYVSYANSVEKMKILFCDALGNSHDIVLAILRQTPKRLS